MNPLAPLYRLADRLRYRQHGDIGRHGEDLAHRYLRAQGFTVVARNWRPPQGGGEIDIMAWEGDGWCSSRSRRALTGNGARRNGTSMTKRYARCAAPRATTFAAPMPDLQSRCASM